MAYEIELSDDALRDYHSLEAHLRSAVREALEIHLRHEPTKVSKSRIKRLRELQRPLYRLRTREVRVYYDVGDETVTILGIVARSASSSWLADNSIPS